MSPDLINEMNGVRTFGRRGWRLPNIMELESLVDMNSHSPALPPGHPFDGIADSYWSSSTIAYEPCFACVLYTRDKSLGVGFKAKPDFHAWALLGISWVTFLGAWT